MFDSLSKRAKSYLAVLEIEMPMADGSPAHWSNCDKPVADGSATTYQVTTAVVDCSQVLDNDNWWQRW